MAAGRPEGAGKITFSNAAEQLLDNGYEPIPVKPGQKAPALSRWTSVVIDEAAIETWRVRHSSCGVGLRTGHLIGIDIDILGPDRAHAAQTLAMERFGETLVRVGRWPKHLLLYRTDTPFTKMKAGQVEILGLGQQFVAFGLHPGTGRQYSWPLGETPLEVPLSDLPVIDQTAAAAFLAEIGPTDHQLNASSGAGRRRKAAGSGDPVRDAQGRITDGRDAWLSQIAFHAVQDVLEAGDVPDVNQLAVQVWQRFAGSSDLSRPKQDGARAYDFSDAARKVQDKLRLARDGRLPPRDTTTQEPEYEAPTLSVEDGRAQLAALLHTFCEQVQVWHQGGGDRLPALGIRATVGLGKSRVARDNLISLAADLRAQGLPHRILVFTASHALAEETAASWQAAGANVAVLRGYERNDPISGAPMCRDLDAVRAALASAQKVRESACSGANGAKCQFFDGCLKQRNLRDVAAADVVVAPYDALFSGLAFERDDVALLMVDEGCWARALEQLSGVFVENIPDELIAGMGGDQIGRGPVGAMADLMVFRGKVAAALVANGPGPVSRTALQEADLTVDDCQRAAQLERWRLRDAKLYPGMPTAERRNAFRIAAGNARILLLAALWQSLANLLASSNEASGQLLIKEPDASGRHEVTLRRVRGLHESLRGKPVLHLDATMRPAIVQRILPDLEADLIDVAAPHMQVRMVSGSFGKSMLCPASGLVPEEAARRANRLQECVEYVQWHARRVFPGRVLVVTYKSIEAAFADIPNVEVAHFNAIAGLDCYNDVGLLISIGRPLPPSQELEALTGAYFGHVPQGRYRRDVAGIRMRSGQNRSLGVLRHEDELAETLRAAICDDELIQVIGRGRGVNRTIQNPLEVHVLSDVVLPLVYDRLTTWDVERPDVLQRMLLAGVAVDSPADAAALHSQLFKNGHQAKMAFERGGFKAQNPMNSSYREMCLKSAAYKRAGRGRGWQRAMWIDGDAATARQRLEAALGDLALWQPE
ncbi:bifunctional DNA primase/polymerase [Roseovarius sp. ZX-A-9]|uniref:bifunctional DNA primase/polymerase n=1 Tax=Roseovarius sp. ZX-A-9 TaxID=3014783 RepID=UPI0023310B47|nr:bifunctional DNA primase/polymerase [Roseovarius sp. ZX-A-9]